MNVAELLELNQEEILDQCLQQVRRTPAAEGLTDPEIRNSLREYLRSLTKTFREGTIAAEASREQRLVDLHLLTRLRQGFNLDDVIHEYTFLGEAVSRIGSRVDPADRPEPQDIERFFLSLNRAVAAAVETFSKQFGEHEQNQKRYLRLLDQIAREALTAGQLPLHERLGDVIKLVLAATQAQTAALLLYRQETKKLKMAASIGILGERAGEYEAALGSDTFVAQIADMDEESILAEQFTADVEVSRPLRESGLESLLGHPLKARGRLLGVLYIGIKERRPFLSWELQRMSALAQRLALLLDNADLFQDRQASIEQLQAERELRERFVSVLAHDLRGPLSTAKMAAQLLTRRLEGLDEPRGLAVRIDRNLDRADRMVRDLLDANRIRAGQRLPLHLEECDLASLARDLVEELETLHGGRFVLKAETAVRGIWGSDELRRAIWNLAINAVKYGAPDQPITITVTQQDSEALVAVHNEGQALSAEERESLFLPFARSHAAQTGGRPGWGLGLTLVRGAALAHGGSVQVESEPGQGTTFTLRLPLDARPHQPSPAPEGVESS
jgi:signal transduction histidine kinase